MNDKEIIIITRGFTRGILNGRKSTSMCYAVTYPLQSYLEYLGLKVKLIEGEINIGNILIQHFWLELQDGRILDPTANQFSRIIGKKMPKIYLGKRPQWYKS